MPRSPKKSASRDASKTERSGSNNTGSSRASSAAAGRSRRAASAPRAESSSGSASKTPRAASESKAVSKSSSSSAGGTSEDSSTGNANLKAMMLCLCSRDGAAPFSVTTRELRQLLSAHGMKVTHNALITAAQAAFPGVYLSRKRDGSTTLGTLSLRSPLQMAANEAVYLISANKNERLVGESQLLYPRPVDLAAPSIIFSSDVGITKSGQTMVVVTLATKDPYCSAMALSAIFEKLRKVNSEPQMILKTCSVAARLPRGTLIVWEPQINDDGAFIVMHDKVANRDWITSPFIPCRSMIAYSQGAVDSRGKPVERMKSQSGYAYLPYDRREELETASFYEFEASGLMNALDRYRSTCRFSILSVVEEDFREDAEKKDADEKITRAELWDNITEFLARMIGDDIL